MKEKTVICASNKLEYKGARGICVGYQMREMDKEQHFLGILG